MRRGVAPGAPTVPRLLMQPVGKVRPPAPAVKRSASRSLERHAASRLPQRLASCYGEGLAITRAANGTGETMATGDRSTAALAMLASVIIAAAPSGSMAARQIQQGTLIHLADGDVQGSQNGLTRQFLGIPFAAPPSARCAGGRRRPSTPWQGVLQAEHVLQAVRPAGVDPGRRERQRGLPVPQRVDARIRRRRSRCRSWCGSTVAGNQQGSASDAVPFPGVPGLLLRRPGARAGARRRRGHDQLSTQRLRVLRACRARRRGSGVSVRRQPGAARPACRARVGAGEHRRVRRQSEEGHDLRRVGRLAGRVLPRRLAGQPAGSSIAASARAAAARRASRRRPRAPQRRRRSPRPWAAAARPTSSPASASCRRVPCWRHRRMRISRFGPVVDGGFLPDQPRTLFDTGRLRARAVHPRLQQPTRARSSSSAYRR